MYVYLILTSGSHFCSFGSKKLQYNFRTRKVTRLQNEKWGWGWGGFGDQVQLAASHFCPGSSYYLYNKTQEEGEGVQI